MALDGPATAPDGRRRKSSSTCIVDARWGWAAKAEAEGFWKALGAEANAAGLYWGGDWKTFRDVAHIQLVPNSELKRVKSESGLRGPIGSSLAGVLERCGCSRSRVR
jgi:hypothetical protein